MKTYRVIKSIAGQALEIIGDREFFEDAGSLARDHGAQGEIIEDGKDRWIFSDGPENIGYYIEDINQ